MPSSSASEIVTGGQDAMTDTQTLIREKTEYVKLEDGRWQAAFPGKRWNLVVTAPTLEQARSDLLSAFDERLFAMLRDDLEPDKRGRPEGEMQAMRRSLGKNVQVRRKR